MSDWLLVDGSSLIFRAFYGVPGNVRSPDGKQVNAVRGFLDNLARLVTERRPQKLAVASDEDWRPAWRVELIPAYKEHRTAEPVPPLLIPQFPVIHEILAAIGVDFVGVTDYEAEDVIATWTARATEAGQAVEIVSGDRDLFALVREPQVRVLYPEKGGLALIDEAEVERRYGVPSRLYADFAVLRGDPSDGLPGMAGVGPKKAAELVSRYGGVDRLIESGRVGPEVGDYLTRALRVVAPVTGLPLELPAGCRSTYPVDPEASAALAERWGLNSSVGRLVTALHLPR